jgi:hypothetical protein
MSITTKLGAGATAAVFALFGGLAIAGADSSSGTPQPSAHVDTDVHPTTTVVHDQSTESDTHGAPTSTPASPHVQTATSCITNHGAMVSAVAHQHFSSGRAHGAAVSAAAHQKCTKAP